LYTNGKKDGGVTGLKYLHQWNQLALFAALALLPAKIYAQEASQFQRDPVEQYGARALTFVIVLGIAVVLFSLVKYRGRLTGPVSWAVLAFGVAILPALSSGFGTVLVFERAERVEFCESCHLTMKSYVTDMKNPQSESLAALHYKNRYIPDNQCYVCHTGYGLFGTVQAKREGMHDVFVYYTRTFKLPVKLRHPYPNNDCLKCHAESVKWLGVHGDFKDDLFAGKTSCLDCHGQTNPPHTLSASTEKASAERSDR
jgi:cytochrome c nitrite reductase small subunit